MERKENEQALEDVSTKGRLGPEWFLIGMGLVFVGLVVFEMFFKSKP